MSDPITPEALAEARQLAIQFNCFDRMHGFLVVDGFAALLAHIRAAATAAEHERCLACVPGGSWCDPQQVADAIRRK